MSAEQKTEFRTRDRWLITAFILPPAAWALHLDVSYMLVPESCGDGTKLILHFVTLGALLVAAIGAAIAWNIRRQCHAESDTVLWIERTKWIAMIALVQSFAFMLVIVAQEIPNLMLRSCD